MTDIPTKKAGEFKLPVLGLGTYGMGGLLERDPIIDEAKEISAIQKAIEMGYTHIDTAEIYTAGFAEMFINAAIKDFDRSKLFITSKVSADHLRYDDVIKACRGSLERMGIKKIDLYLIHWANPEFPLQKTLQAMDYLLENEMIKNIGVSNFESRLLEEAQSYTKYKIVNNQIHYSLSARYHEDIGTLAYCEKNDILVTVYRPLGKGELTLPGNTMLDQMAEKYKKTPAQVALNWVIQKPNIVTLVKSSNPKHLEDNLGALDWKLESEDEKNLDENFPRGETLHV